MNFFEKQEQARKTTSFLIFYFILAVVLIIVAINLIVLGTFLYLNTDQYFFTFNDSTQITLALVRELALQMGIIVTPIVLVVILFGTLFKLLRLRGGGLALAKMVKAKPIDLATSNPLERRFINVVEEMAIASGVSIPKLFVMEEEEAINAFVAGTTPEDQVMVITKGALDQLSRDELQGVIGHEFSHIFNSDMKINLKLIGLLGGIFAIGQIGYYMMRLVGNSGRGRRSKKSGGKGHVAIFLMGLGIFIVGYIGLFFGRLIKASISRQRELLADAASVQYTRNPKGLVDALRRIQQSEEGTYLKSKYVEDISHLCFCSSRGLLFRSLLATHPPIDQRILELDPQKLYSNDKLLDIEKKTKVDVSKKPTLVAPSGSLKPVDFLPLGLVVGQQMTLPAIASANAFCENIGNLSEEHIVYAQELLNSLPPEIKTLAHQADQVELLFYALMIPSEKEKADIADQILSQYLSDSQRQMIETIIPQVTSLAHAKLILVDVAMPAFRQNKLEERQRVLKGLEALAELHQEKLFSFLLVATIGRFARKQERSGSGERYDTFEPVKKEVSILLSSVIHYGHHKQEEAQVIFQKILQKLSVNNLALIDFTPNNLKELATALTTLNQLYPMCKQKLIHACIECIQIDGQITLEEAKIVRAIAAGLDCPVPPIIPTTTKN